MTSFMLAPMEAKLVAELPTEPGWQFEPKWDGFRALIFRHGKIIEILSKSGKSLARYFPEIVAMIASLSCDNFILDGELILPINGVLSFDALQARLHPAASRVAKLSEQTPAQMMLFDCLGIDGDDLLPAPLVERRAVLERFHALYGNSSLLLSARSDDAATAQGWLARSGGALDGVVAKRRDDGYRPGERAMLKVKNHRSADCVVGGFRRANGGGVGSLLLGLYDDGGLLNHVGFTSGLDGTARRRLLTILEPLIETPGFTGKAPGGPSRWNDGKESRWEPLRSELVVEVRYDQVTGQRFRHGTKLLRWRPDKAPAQCGMEQLIHEMRPAQLATIGV